MSSRNCFVRMPFRFAICARDISRPQRMMYTLSMTSACCEDLTGALADAINAPLAIGLASGSPNRCNRMHAR
jgi:hypothetical protein